MYSVRTVLGSSPMKHRVFFSELARLHLRQMSARERRIACDGIASSLQHEPEKQTRKLKALRPNPFAKFELRIGQLRVFFEVRAPEREVVVLAIGRKEGDRLYIGGKEVDL
jgi:mRNA-degrading endonuclease RelE of RelBE toxin-antitoxin system